MMGLASAGLAGQQEPDAGQLHEVLIDRFQLVGQRVHAGDREAEVRVELVGDAQRVGIQCELQQVPIAVVEALESMVVKRAMSSAERVTSLNCPDFWPIRPAITGPAPPCLVVTTLMAR